MRFGKLFNPSGNRVAIVPDDVAGGGGVTIYTKTIDFGSIPRDSITTSFSHIGALINNKVIITASGSMPVGVDLDELEMDTLIASAYVSAADTITVIINAIPGPVSGERNFNYQII